MPIFPAVQVFTDSWVVCDAASWGSVIPRRITAGSGQRWCQAVQGVLLWIPRSSPAFNRNWEVYLLPDRWALQQHRRTLSSCKAATHSFRSSLLLHNRQQGTLLGLPLLASLEFQIHHLLGSVFSIKSMPLFLISASKRLLMLRSISSCNFRPSF